MIVVSDTSPLNYLILIHLVDVLGKLYAEVAIPSEVLQELSAPEAPSAVRAWVQERPSWIVVHELTAPTLDVVGSLDAGEAAAASLAVELGVKNFLVDDLEARQVARVHLGLEVIGTLGVLLLADDAGLIDGLAAYQRLRTETNFRVSADLENSFNASLQRRRTMGVK